MNNKPASTIETHDGVDFLGSCFRIADGDPASVDIENLRMLILRNQQALAEIESQLASVNSLNGALMKNNDELQKHLMDLRDEISEYRKRKYNDEIRIITLDTDRQNE